MLPVTPSPQNVADYAAHRATIVFDFDGTVCLGDGPVLSFARTLDRDVPGHGFERAVREFLAAPDALDAFSACDDPYDVIAILAADAGLPRSATDAAYGSSRAAAARSGIQAPAGLRSFVRALPVESVLVTNSPPSEFGLFLTRLGLEDVFASVVTSAGKPAGMHALVRRHLRNGPVLSVGDKWVNDLAPARYLGADTALVDTFARKRDRGRATYRAPSLVELYPCIREWCRTAIGAPRDEVLAETGTRMESDHASN